MKTIFKTEDGKEFEKEQDAVWHERSLKQVTEVNTTQMLIFELIKRASFNGFDGEQTVKYLIKNKSDWIGVMPEVQDYALRDISDDNFHIDTVLVKCESEAKAKDFLIRLNRNLHPDEIDLEENPHDYHGKEKSIIRMWWD